MLYAGIDIGGMNIKMGLVDENGNIVVSNSIKTDCEKSISQIIDDMVSNVKVLCAKIGVEVASLEGIGCGVPGVADSQKGIVTAAANIGWYNVELAKEMTDRLGLPCKIGNDANCAASGEQMFGSAKQYKSVVFITLGTGVGSGIIIDNKLVEGEGSAGAECGHITIVYNGEKCNCGKRGCWERYASATALMQQTARAIEQNPTCFMSELAQKQGKISGRTAFEAAENGDKVAKAVVEQYVEYVAAGIISLGCVLHPQAFIIGGGISHEGDALMIPLKQKVDAYTEVSKF
ncbi:MAG: ROK family protein, partial [Clostridia bacterium]